jgi:hypothetical protein
VYGGTEKFQTDPHWNNCLLFFEYFHGDNGAGIGASHQTGWTGLVGKLIEVFGRLDGQKLSVLPDAMGKRSHCLARCGVCGEAIRQAVGLERLQRSRQMLQVNHGLLASTNERGARAGQDRGRTTGRSADHPTGNGESRLRAAHNSNPRGSRSCERLDQDSKRYCGRTLVTLMYWLPKLSISYCPFFLSKRILAAAMI